MLLSLPTLAPTIPTQIEFGGVSVRHLSLVLALSRLGLISEAQYASLSDHSLTATAVNGLVEQALRAKFGDLYRYQVLSTITALEVSSDDSHHDTYHSETVADLSIPFIAASSHPCDEWVCVGPFMTQVDALEPGLGRLCMEIMDRILCWFGYPHTPAGVMDMARDWCWYGEDDETVALAEMTEEGTNPDDLDVVRRVDLIDGIPAWAYEWHKDPDTQLFNLKDMRGLASKHAHTPFGPFLEHMAFLADDLASDMERIRFYEEGMALFPPVVLCWENRDQFDVVIDDVHDREMQSGEGAPWAWVIEMGLSLNEISEGLNAICETGQVLKALDNALVAIKEFSA